MRAFLVFKSSLCGLTLVFASTLPAMAQVSEVETRPPASQSNGPPSGEDIMTIAGPETLSAKRSDPVLKEDKRPRASSRKKNKKLLPPDNIPAASPKPFSARSEYSRRATPKSKRAKKNKKDKKDKNSEKERLNE